MKAKKRAAMLLKTIKRNPCVFASCREALLARVCGIVSVVCKTFDSRIFYDKHLRKASGQFIDLAWNFDYLWVSQVVKDARRTIRHVE